jgi:hypothetical protein
VCPVGTGWYRSACDVCVKVVAGVGVQGTNGNNVPATAAQLNHPLDVSVDAAGNIYIAGRAECRDTKAFDHRCILVFRGSQRWPLLLLVLLLLLCCSSCEVLNHATI